MDVEEDYWRRKTSIWYRHIGRADEKRWINRITECNSLGKEDSQDSSDRRRRKTASSVKELFLSLNKYIKGHILCIIRYTCYIQVWEKYSSPACSCGALGNLLMISVNQTPAARFIPWESSCTRIEHVSTTHPQPPSG